MPKYTRVRTASDLFPVHVVDQDGLPHVELTAYACRSPRHHSPRTAYAYTGEVVTFASRAESDPVVRCQGWRLLGPPDEARRVISHVLAVEMRCGLVVSRDRLGFETCSVKPTWQTGRGLERLLAALRSFYAVLRLHGFYPHANPMEAAGAWAAIEAKVRAEAEAFRRAHGRERMPPESGVDAPMPVVERRSSAAYFRLRGERWLPAVLDDPALMGDVLAAGEQWGWLKLTHSGGAFHAFAGGPFHADHPSPVFAGVQAAGHRPGPCRARSRQSVQGVRANRGDDPQVGCCRWLPGGQPGKGRRSGRGRWWLVRDRAR